MKLLAINFGGLGDEVLFLPTLTSIKKAHPDWQITILTEPRGKAIKQLSKTIDDNIVFDIKKQLTPRDFFDLIQLLRGGKYDIVLSSGGSSKVSILLFLSGIAKRIGYDSGALSRMLLTNSVKLKRDQYAGQMYHDLVSGLDITLEAQAPRIDVDASSLNKMSTFLRAERKQDDSAQNTQGTQAVKERTEPHLVLIHPGMSHLALLKGIIKTWSSENWAGLIERLLADKHDVILCGGPDDQRTISDITAILPRLQLASAGSTANAGVTGSAGGSPAFRSNEIGNESASGTGERNVQRGQLINAFGKTASIQDLAALMQLSDLIVCVDSAPMHMASALDKRIVALFGPTDPAKLFLQSDKAVALRDMSAAKSEDELLAQFQASAKEVQSTDGATSQTEPCVQIPLDTVYQTVRDQLHRLKSQESSTESRQT